MLVLGPLVQVTLPSVPWGWIRTLTTPGTDPLLPAPVVEPAAVPTTELVAEPVVQPVAAARPMHDRPQRERRMPSWRSPMHTTRRRDRERA